MTPDRRTTRFGPLQQRVLALLALGPADTLQVAERLGQPLHRVRASLGALRRRRVVEHRGSPSLGYRGRLPALWRLSSGPPVPFRRPRSSEEVERDADVLEGLTELGPSAVPALVEYLGRTRSNVIRALRSLQARELVERTVGTGRGQQFRWAVRT